MGNERTTNRTADNGLLWAFGTLGVLAAAGAYVSRSGRRSFRQASYLPTPVRWWKRGSFAEELNLSPFQKRLLYVSREYKDNPEVAIRGQDVIFAVIHGEHDKPIGSIRSSNELLIDDAKAFRGPDSDLSTYLDMQNQCIVANDHPVWHLDFQRPTKYERLAPWIAKLMAKVLRDARRNRLETQNPRNLRDYERDPDETQRELPETVQKILQWQDFYAKNLEPIADWYQYEMEEARQRNRPIQDIMPMSWDEATEKMNQWHDEIARLTAQRAAVPAEHAFNMADGWSLQRLLTKVQFDGETNVLFHCVGTGSDYRHKVERGEIAIYSIRDSAGVPRYTIEVILPSRNDPTTRINQVKGTKNCLPGRRFVGALTRGGFCTNDRPATPEELTEDLRVIPEALSLIQPRQDVSRMIHSIRDTLHLIAPWDRLQRRKRMIREIVRTLPQGQRAAAQQRFVAMPQQQLDAAYRPIQQQQRRRRREMAPVEVVRQAVRSVATTLYPEVEGLLDYAVRMVQSDSAMARTIRQQAGADVKVVVRDDQPEEIPPAFWSQVQAELEAHRPDLGWEEYRPNLYVIR
jgi:hypothetical protein